MATHGGNVQRELLMLVGGVAVLCLGGYSLGPSTAAPTRGPQSVLVRARPDPSGLRCPTNTSIAHLQHPNNETPISSEGTTAGEAGQSAPVEVDARVLAALAAPADCQGWGCSCEGFSRVFGAITISKPQTNAKAQPTAATADAEPTREVLWMMARDRAGVRQWYLAHGCHRQPPRFFEGKGYDPRETQKLAPDAPPRRADTVSVLSFSNGQRYCNENTLLNALYQARPDGIALIELVVFETSLSPSDTWKTWTAEYNSSGFTIVYRWFNASARVGSLDNPQLGTLRNLAALAASGETMINMDNDDVYHPHFVQFVLGHLRRNGWGHLLVLHAAQAEFNPDGTHRLSRRDPRRVGAHISSMTAAVLRAGCTYQQVAATEEARVGACLDRTGIPHGEVDTLNGTYGTPFLLIKVSSPLSITNQMWNIAAWNRLKQVDVANVIRGMERFYRDVHILQRPVDAPVFAPTLADQLPSADPWLEFHRRHPMFTSPQHYPVCGGFAALQGQEFEHSPGTTLQIKVDGPEECCALCSQLYNKTAFTAVKSDRYFKDDVYNGFCGGFTYENASNLCTLGQGHLRYHPWSWSTHVSGGRVATCGSCGKGLDPDPKS
eukprot:m.8640 g.8640  ORF g.8640 m.8640 type:complete len:607 (-) comp4084_c0_seq1:145-1965(-)